MSMFFEKVTSPVLDKDKTNIVATVVEYKIFTLVVMRKMLVYPPIGISDGRDYIYRF